MSDTANPTIEEIREEALAAATAASTTVDINKLSIRYLGRKGAVTQFLRNIASLPPEERPAAGKKANEVKAALEAVFAEAADRLNQK